MSRYMTYMFTLEPTVRTFLIGHNIGTTFFLGSANLIVHAHALSTLIQTNAISFENAATQIFSKSVWFTEAVITRHAPRPLHLMGQQKDALAFTRESFDITREDAKLIDRNITPYREILGMLPKEIRDIWFPKLAAELRRYGDRSYTILDPEIGSPASAPTLTEAGSMIFIGYHHPLREALELLINQLGLDV